MKRKIDLRRQQNRAAQRLFAVVVSTAMLVSCATAPPSAKQLQVQTVKRAEVNCCCAHIALIVVPNREPFYEMATEAPKLVAAAGGNAMALKYRTAELSWT